MKFLSVFHSKLILLALILVVSTTFSTAQNAGDNIFDNSYLHQIKITTSTPFESLEFGGEYFVADVEIDGVALDSVAVKPKGFISILVSDQTPLRIDFNRYIDDLEYDGIKKINLSNNLDDQYLQRENIAYLLDRRAGYPGPRTAFAEVVYNDEFVGLYGLGEHVDKTFLSQYFADDEGDLYKGSIDPTGFDVDVKIGTIDNYSEYINLANAENFGTYVHFRNYLKYMALQILISDWDSYPYDRHNYYIYHEPKSDLLNFIPWDHNFAFGESFGQMESAYPRLDLDIILDPDNIVLYQQTMCELLDYLLDESYINEIIDANYTLLSSNNYDVQVQEPTSLKEFIQNRKETIRDLLLEGDVTCESLIYPYEIGDLVINEFVAYSDEQSGVQEPNGGTPDWIELYNNSDQAIEINERFYLSDDKDFLKKWYFPTATSIPANGYVTLWADKDIHQEGIHSNFKIEKNGGDLFLVYEDLTILDQVNYPQQELNQAFARIPNGTGQFVIQDHTFASDNEVPLFVDSEFSATDLRLYPNPSNSRFWIESKFPIEQLEIYNSIGQLQSQLTDPVFPIDISNLQSGLYFAKTILDNDRSTILSFSVN